MTTTHIDTPLSSRQTSSVKRHSDKSVRAQTMYNEILKRVHNEGLLKKNPGFYLRLLGIVAIISLVMWGAIVTSGVLYGDGWLSMLWVFPIACFLGVVTAQFGFVAHEAAHKQVFESNKTNEWVGLILANLFAGMGYGFWLNKHNRHHQRPNQLGYDPDIQLPVLSFNHEQVEVRKGPEKWAAKHQGKLFILLLSGSAFLFVQDSFKSLIRPHRYVKHRWLEAVLFFIRQVTPFVVFFILFNPIQAVLLYMGFMLTFGLFIGGAFAPNHKGMPIVPEGSKLDFFHRQVLMSRNITPSFWKDIMMGGLNYQVEHHLFPSMPRTSLPRARELVKEFCEETGTPYTEVGLFESFAIIREFLDDVGLNKSDLDPFTCPMVADWRPRM